MPSTSINLREMFLATSIKFKWWNPQKAVEIGPHERMTAAIEADPKSIKTRKAIYSPKTECIAAINTLKNAIVEHWKSNTIQYTEDSIRLIKREDCAAFNIKMREYEDKIRDLAHNIQEHRNEILTEARNRLQQAFCPGNYPADLSQLYGLEWSFPSIDPPTSLESLAPEIYQQQQALVAAKLQEAATLAEQTFAAELQKLVGHLQDCLTPNADGSKKIFRDSTVENFAEFFARFQKLNVTNNAELDSIVNQAQAMLANIQPSDLRTAEDTKNHLRSQLTNINNKLQPLLIDQPRRKIIPIHRQPQTQATA